MVTRLPLQRTSETRKFLKKKKLEKKIEGFEFEVDKAGMVLHFMATWARSSEK